MFRLTLKSLLARKVRLLMSALAIVLGIGFLAGVLLFSGALNSTFDGIVKGSTPAAVVRAQDQGPAGQPGAQDGGWLTPAVIDAIGQVPGVARAAGSLQSGSVYLLDKKGRLVGTGGAPTLTMNRTGVPNLLGEPSMKLLSGTWAEQPDQVVLDGNTASRTGYRIGDTVNIILPAASSTQDSRRTLTMTGTAEFNGGGTAGATLLILSDEGAQKLIAGGRDVYTRVSLAGDAGVSQKQLAAAVEPEIPDGFEAVTGDEVVKDSQDRIGEFLGVITSFLVAFAVIAILVGGFIIANTFSILVAQRTRELALLRALGASAAQVRRSVLVEAAVMALLGATVGLALGYGLALGLVAMFSTFGLSIVGSQLTLTPGIVITSYVVALVVTMLSAYLPARRASKVAPVTAMREEFSSASASLRLRSVLGFLAVGVGIALAVAAFNGAPGGAAIWIGVASVIWILSAAVLAPVLGGPVLLICRWIFTAAFGTTGKLAAQNARRNPRRTGATASALMIGLALASAVGTLAASFSATADQLVDDQFESDFLVQAVNFRGFTTAIGDDMAKVPGVATVARDQYVPGTVNGTDTDYLGLSENYLDVYDFDVKEGQASLAPQTAIIQEAAAKKFKVGVGDKLTLGAPGGGSTRVKVVAIVEDTPVLTSVNVPLSELERMRVTRADFDLSINVEPGADVSAVKADLKKVVEDVPIVSVSDKAEFAETIRGQINQLLYIIYALLALAVIIAVIGIVNTLGLSVLERTREIGLLRAVGLTRGQLGRVITMESIAIALTGALLGMAVGVTIGVLLRWALKDDIASLAIPTSSLLIFAVAAVLAGVLAAAIPAIRGARMKVLDAIATE